MALRTIRTEGDPILRKICRPVTQVDDRTKELIGDMLDTMYDADGVGLAAPQVGILKRIVVIDVGDGPVVMVNPEILETSGSQTGQEGCLSIPGKAGIVTRPMYVKAKAYDENMNEISGGIYWSDTDGHFAMQFPEELASGTYIYELYQVIVDQFISSRVKFSF